MYGNENAALWRHDPLTLKHPPRSVMPLAKVDEPVLSTVRSVAYEPLLVVEPIANAIVELDVDAMLTERAAHGVVDAMPTLGDLRPPTPSDIPKTVRIGLPSSCAV